MQIDFINRGYLNELIVDAAKRAYWKNRLELLQPKIDKEVFKGITTAFDFTPLTPTIKKIIFNHWHLVNEIPGCEILPRIGWRKTKSIKDIVSRSDIRTVPARQYVTTGHF